MLERSILASTEINRGGSPRILLVQTHHHTATSRHRHRNRFIRFLIIDSAIHATVRCIIIIDVIFRMPPRNRRIMQSILCLLFYSYRFFFKIGCINYRNPDSVPSTDSYSSPRHGTPYSSSFFKEKNAFSFSGTPVSKVYFAALNIVIRTEPCRGNWSNHLCLHRDEPGANVSNPSNDASQKASSTFRSWRTLSSVRLPAVNSLIPALPRISLISFKATSRCRFSSMQASARFR